MGMSESNLRIAFVTDEFITELPDAGGIGMFTNRLTRAIHELGHEVEVFTRAYHDPRLIDHDGIRARQAGRLKLWQQRFEPLPGVRAQVVADATGNPIDRLRLYIAPDAAGTTAWDLAAALAAGDPPVVVRDDESDLGYFDMDPCNLHPGEAQIVGKRLREVLSMPPGDPTDIAELKQEAHAKRIRWPD